MYRIEEVYPRVGGGNSSRLVVPADSTGLSPRGRGKLHAIQTRSSRFRSIPAWAGETMRNRVTFRMNPVYPRVGGGNVRTESILQVLNGLSPRGRGKLYLWESHEKGEYGLSPRGRGKLGRRDSAH